MTAKTPAVEKPKIPIDAIRPPQDRNQRPLGRKSLIETTPDTRKKPAYTVKSSLLG